MQDYTISVWVNANSLEDHRWKSIISKWGWGNGYYLGINPDNLKLRFNPGGIPIELDDQFSIRKWTHIAVTHDSSILKIYLNGSISKEVSVENVMEGTHYPFRIGGQDGFLNGTSFNGSIDDVLIYDRALDTDEIIELFIGKY